MGPHQRKICPVHLRSFSKQVLTTKVKVFRIIPEFRILRPTVHPEILNNADNNVCYDLFTLSKDNWPFKLEVINIL